MTNSHKTVVGTSLSFCVKDILSGLVHIDDVVGMEPHTRINNETELEQVIKQYMNSYWKEYDESDVRKVVHELYYNKPFYQSRIEHDYCICDSDQPTWMRASISLNQFVKYSNEDTLFSPFIKYIKQIFKAPREIVPHHDSRTSSYYQISQQALRDARKY